MEFYTKKEIDDICDEIEKQWQYHQTVRRVFSNKAGKTTPTWQGIPHWLNQSYIIRLFGILDEKQITKFAKENIYVEIVRLLRNSVGAHTRGYRNPKRPDAKKVTDLIKNHLDPNKKEMTSDIRVFLLPIEILGEIKEKCKLFVESLVDRPKPKTDKIKFLLKEIARLSEQEQDQLFEHLKTTSTFRQFFRSS